LIEMLAVIVLIGIVAGIVVQAIGKNVDKGKYGAGKAQVQMLAGKIEGYERLLLENEILIARARGCGVIPRALAISASLSGPMLRGSGVAWVDRRERMVSTVVTSPARATDAILAVPFDLRIGSREHARD
jgi:Ni,Fe-hydrogenase III large subunit